MASDLYEVEAIFHEVEAVETHYVKVSVCIMAYCSVLSRHERSALANAARLIQLVLALIV